MRRRGHDGKQKFYSEKEARIHIHHMKQWKKTENKDALNVYKCNFCDAYHVGHTPKWLEANFERIQKWLEANFERIQKWLEANFERIQK